MARIASALTFFSLCVYAAPVLAADWQVAGVRFQAGAGDCDQDPLLDEGEQGELVIELQNNSNSQRTGSRLCASSHVPELLFPAGPCVDVGVTVAGGRSEVSLGVSFAGLIEPGRARIDLLLQDPELAEAISSSIFLAINQDEVRSNHDDVEATLSTWIRGGQVGGTQGWTRFRDEGDDGVWFGPSSEQASDVTLTSAPIKIAKGQNFAFGFSHRYAFAVGDGAVVEVSVDNGRFRDVSAFAPIAYDGVIHAASSPLYGRPAFTGVSQGMPARSPVWLELGTALSGHTVRFRLRTASDESGAWWGWQVDDLSVAGAANLPFIALGPDDHHCLNRAPIAITGPSRVIAERSQARVQTSMSWDPDGDSLSFRIRQLSGPAVELVDGAFTAPEALGQVSLMFEVVAFDGQLTSAPAYQSFVVRNVDPIPALQPMAPVTRPPLR